LEPKQLNISNLPAKSSLTRPSCFPLKNILKRYYSPLSLLSWRFFQSSISFLCYSICFICASFS